MSLSKNIIANYAGYIYVALVGIVAMPLYIRYMGIEAFGIIGFFAMMQALFQILDMGLTSTMAREAARFRGGGITSNNLSQLFKSMEKIFLSIAMIGGSLLALSSNQIATNWLDVRALNIDEVSSALTLTAITISVRWNGGLYRSYITGFEQLIWLNYLNVGVATFRYLAVVPILAFVDSSISTFFLYQAVVSLLELIILVAKVRFISPKINATDEKKYEKSLLKNQIKFSLSIAFTGTIWAVVTQLDKLVLSKVLTLTEYAYFSLAIMMANGIMAACGPIYGALLPRMTVLTSMGDKERILAIYKKTTQLLAILVIPLMLILTLFSKEVLFAWTGDIDIAEKSTTILTMYSAGNGILAFGALANILLLSKGDLRMIKLGSSLFFILIVPGVTVAALNYGSTGAASAWLIGNVLFLIYWLPKIHASVFGELHPKWATKEVFRLILYAVIFALAFRFLTPFFDSRLVTTATLFIILIALIAMSIMNSPDATKLIRTIKANRS